jgi:hypothetical protein
MSVPGAQAARLTGAPVTVQAAAAGDGPAGLYRGVGDSESQPRCEMTRKQRSCLQFATVLVQIQVWSQQGLGSTRGPRRGLGNS